MSSAKCHRRNELTHETVSRIYEFNHEKIQCVGARSKTLYTALGALLTYNIFLPRSFVLAQGSPAFCRIINNLVQEMLQVITVRSGNISTYSADRKKLVSHQIYLRRVLPPIRSISFHLLLFLSIFTLGNIQGNSVLKFLRISYIFLREYTHIHV